MGTNPYGSCDSSCNLIVEIPDGYKKPEFLTPLYDVKTSEMNPVRLEVKVDAVPPPEISWYKEYKNTVKHSVSVIWFL